jgi:hypothetical protein
MVGFTKEARAASTAAFRKNAQLRKEAQIKKIPDDAEDVWSSAVVL